MFHRSLISIGLLALAAGVAASSPLHSGPVQFASDSLRSAWQQRVQAATALAVRHEEVQTRPTSFRSARRSEMLVRITHADDRIESNADVTRWLAGALERARPGAGNGACPDTTSYDQFMLQISEGFEAIYTPQCNSVSFQDKDHFVLTDTPGDEGPALLAVLAKALPDDLRLDAIVPCTALKAAPAEKGTADSQFVYLEELPEAIRKVPPDYPDDARNNGVQGEVDVQALIGKTGEVERTIVLNSVPALDGSAVRAVEQWQFRPALSNGKPVAVWVAIPVRVTLR